MINIIAGQPITTPTPAVDPTVFTKISFATALPASIPINELVIHKSTMWRGLRYGEIASVNEGTPIPVKGYREFRALKLSPVFYTSTYINDFDFDFQIAEMSPGVYIFSKSGNLPILPLLGDPQISLVLSFYDDTNTYSYSYNLITSGSDTGKIQILVKKNEATANTPAGASFYISLFANYSLQSL